MKSIFETLFPNPFSSSPAERLSVSNAIQNRLYRVKVGVANGANTIAAEHELLKTPEATQQQETAKVIDMHAYVAEQQARQREETQRAAADLANILGEVNSAYGESRDLTPDQIRHIQEVTSAKQEASAAPVELQDGQIIELDAERLKRQIDEIHAAAPTVQAYDERQLA